MSTRPTFVVPRAQSATPVDPPINSPPSRATPIELTILGELAALRQDVAELRASHDDLVRRILDSNDRRTGESLIPVLGAIFNGRQFSTADIAALALGNSLHGRALCTLIGDRLGETNGLKATGRLLARLAGARFRNYRLVAAGARRGARLWTVSKIARRIVLVDDR